MAAIFRRYPVLLVGLVARFAHAQNDALTLHECATVHSFNLPSVPVVTLLTAQQDAWVEVQERGQRLLISEANSSDVISISQPLRFGSHWVRVRPGGSISIARRERNGAAGKFIVQLHCTPDSLDAQLAWLKKLRDVDIGVNAPRDLDQLTDLQVLVDSAEQSATTDFQRALARHYRAMVYLASNKAREASNAFAVAEKTWSDLADAPRAHAARLGRIEELRSISDFQAVLGATLEPDSAPKDADYFVARAQNARCLALASLGDFVSSSKCFDWVLARLRELHENAEYASTLQGYANLQLKRGLTDAARELAIKGIELTDGSTVGAMTRGRFHDLLAAVELRSGNVASALRHTEDAENEFQHAGEDALRWRANSYLAEASIHTNVGNYDEAYAALATMLRLFPTNGDPRRIAAAMATFANLEALSGSPTAAAFSWRAAESMYQSLQMTSQRDSARLARLVLQVRADDYVEAEAAIAEKSPIDPTLASSRTLLALELALKRGDLTAAGINIDSLLGMNLPFAQQQRFRILQARYFDLAGDKQQAFAALVNLNSHIYGILDQTDNRVLRHLLALRHRQQLRMAFQIALADRSPSPQIIFDWLLATSRADSLAVSNGTSSSNVKAFEEALAEELLSTTSKPNKSTTDHKLLSILTAKDDGERRVTAPPPLSLDSIQQYLAPNAASFAYLDGDTRGGVLWITRDGAHVLEAAAPDAVRASTLTLRAALRTPATPLAEVQDAAQTLSTQLLGSLPAGTPPKHLYVLADEMMPRVAWNTLTWPGQTAPLLVTTTIEFVHLARDDAARANTQTAHGLHLIVSSQDANGAAPLAHLANANAEPQLIRAALASPNVPSARPALTLAEGERATREAVLSALDEPGAWVHIAAHGMAQPHRIGYAGLWLAPSAAEKTAEATSAAQTPSAENSTRASTTTERATRLPAFLSWLDILERGVRADLVVLNACQLGDSGTAINGNLSFADAVSRAGAKQVVAAAWPVSDAAAALWVPEFYSALAADPDHNAASALRAAQLRLRASRAFAHPFFWAGMQTIERIQLRSIYESTTVNR